MDATTEMTQIFPNLFPRIGNAIITKDNSTMKGPKRNTRGREITWLSSNTIHKSVPTH